MTTVSALRAAAKRLDYLLQEEGCEDDFGKRVSQLLSHLNGVEELLYDEEASKTISRDFNKQVIQLAYDIEDAVEVEAYARQKAASRGKSGVLIRRLVKNYSTAMFMQDPHHFNRRIDNLKHIMGASRRGKRAGLSNRALKNYQNYIHSKRTTVVVVEDAQELRSVLVGEEPELCIAICDMGGSRKTNFAESVCNDTLVKEHFHICAWPATGGMDFQARHFMETMLSCLATDMSADEIVEMETLELVMNLYKAQFGKRYLVVLEDVRFQQGLEWNALGFAFLDEHIGSRIVVTTRNTDIVGSIQQSQEWTSERETAELSEMGTGLENVGMLLDPEREKIGRQRVRRWRDLPLAMTLIGGLRTTYECFMGSNQGESSSYRGERLAPIFMEEADRLRSVLVGGGSELSVIAICGEGGSGKTSLAQSVYNDPRVKEHFQMRAWVTVGRSGDRQVWKTILSSFSLEWSEIAEMGTLWNHLVEAHKARSCLVVLDDVWFGVRCYNLQHAFEDNRNGSRIVVTTRTMNAARSVTSRIHQMQPLTEQKSWQLFKLKAGLEDLGAQLDPETEKIGRETVGRCGGLPFSLTLLSGIFRGKNLLDWDASLRKLQSDQTLAKAEAEDILALSYKQLPSHLKPCFLYMGQFPPDQAIALEKLYLLWMAEGLISSMSVLGDATRIQTAEYYFNQLVYRRLVIVEGKEEMSVSRRSKSCHLHHLIRDLCIREAKQEEFYEVIDFEPGNKISFFTRRVAVYLNKPGDRNDLPINILGAKNIRSILFFDTDESPPKSTWPREFSNLEEFPSTRVLDFAGVDFRVKKLPRGINKLIHLRYLSFRGCYLQELPSSLGNLLLLETLDLLVRDSCVMTIPNVLRKLSRLRHLYFPRTFKSDERNKLKLDGLEKLEILVNFHAGICDSDDLLRLENLRILTGVVDGNHMDLKNTIISIRFLSGNASLVVKSFPSYSPQEKRSIVAALLECNALTSLGLFDYLPDLPFNEGIGSNFTELIFGRSMFKQDQMPVLGKLPNLRSLVLCDDAFVGRKMVFYALNFPRLTSLKLETLLRVEKLEVEAGGLPRLTILTIHRCDKLELMLQGGLAEISTLRKLMIGSMPQGFKNQVKSMIEELRALGVNEVTTTSL
ncbi:UNVERIFIED_CONTAM: Disease resistance RPP8-like protein 3 [Sesamum indicum]